MESLFVTACPIYFRFFTSVKLLSHSFFGIIKHLYMHKLQLIFLNDLIASMVLRCLNTLNAIQFSKFVCDVVDLNWCSQLAANESYFFIFENALDIKEMTLFYFLRCLLRVSYLFKGEF